MTDGRRRKSWQPFRGMELDVCFPPSWFSMEQLVDLKAEGLWEKLLDHFQPEIQIQDW